MSVCAVCKNEAPDMDHHFFEGVAPLSFKANEKPTAERAWVIRAPIYFKANADNTAAIEGYCSPRCSLIGMKQ